MTQQEDCPFSQEPLVQQRGFDHPNKIAELEVSTAILAHEQYFRGYTLLVLREHAIELWELDVSTRQKFMEDANQMALALNKTFKPLKMNYSLMGNTLAHRHWHLTPRRLTDPNPKRPIWENLFPDVRLDDEELRQLADEIRGNIS